MPDVFAVADLFVDLVRRQAANDVALVVYYGSYATGSASPRSDLDLYYIPDDGKASELYRSVVYQGCPFEFWGVSWEFAERIASGKHRWSVAPSIIANAKVLFARSPADESRFVSLQANISRLQTPASKGEMLKLAQTAFDGIASPLSRLILAEAQHDTVGVVWSGSQVIDIVLDCLALVNQTFFVKNWASNIAQLAQLTLCPPHLTERITTILTSSDLTTVSQTAASLVTDTRAIILAQQHVIRETPTSASVFNGYYPAIKEYVNKIVSACERHDWINASVAAAQMQKEVAMMLAYVEDGIMCSEFNIFVEYRAAFDRLGFPDLTAEKRDFAHLADLARQFDTIAQAYLIQRGVSLNSADEFSALKNLIG